MADLQIAKPYDTILVLENLTFLAYNAENDGDVFRAMELFRILKPLAAQELKELAASYNIELDAWTKEAIGDILGVE